MNVVHFENNSSQFEKLLDNAITEFLAESSALLVARTAENTKVDTGQLKASWTANVDEQKRIAIIGSPLKNALWEEFGTGEYALDGNGRKNGWVYCDADRKWHFTYGKKPKRPFLNAYLSSKANVINLAENILKEELY